MRFDGLRFTVFDKRNTPEFKSNVVTALLDDGAQALWIGTDCGLNRFQNSKFSLFTVKEGLADNSIFMVAEDHGAIFG